MSAFVFDQPDQTAWLILDSETMREPAYGFQPLVDGWETIEEMEAGLGIPEGALVETMRRTDKHAAHGEDPSSTRAATTSCLSTRGRGVPTT